MRCQTGPADLTLIFPCSGGGGLHFCSARTGDLPNPGVEPRSPALQVDSFPVEPPGKLKNTAGVGSISLLQQIFRPGIVLGPPALEVDSQPAKLPGKPSARTHKSYSSSCL